MKKLENKIAVVTGGTSGIGLATATLFAQEGARVAITGRDQTRLNQAAAQIGGGTLTLQADVTDVPALEQAFRSVDAQLGSIDVLVVNAGVALNAAFSDYSEALFDQVAATNFKGVFFTVQKALPYLAEGASVILTSSTLSDTAVPYTSAYSATKAAVRSLARTLSAELQPRGIRVNVLAPGPVDTPMLGGGTEDEANERRSQYANATLVKRLGTPEEMAKALLFLASDDSSYMVGSELLLDGGIRNR